MLTGNINKLKNYGFEGFHTVNTLQKNGCSTIPKEKGIYLVLNHGNTDSFLEKNVGGHFKGKNPTIPIARLQ